MAKASSGSSQRGKRRRKRGVRTTDPDLLRQAEVLRRKPDDEIDFSDIPEILDWTNAEVGKFYRPLKEQISIRLDSDILEWFRMKSDGRGYQSHINNALRTYIAIQKHE